MKKTIGLGLLMLTGITAFAAPAAAYERFNNRDARKEVVVVRHDDRRYGDRREVRVQYDRCRR